MPSASSIALLAAGTANQNEKRRFHCNVALVMTTAGCFDFILKSDDLFC